MQPSVGPTPEQQCKAFARTTGKRCGAYKLPGLDICRMHGATNEARAIGKMRIAAKEIDRKANAMLAHEGIEPVEDPLAELSKLASASGALMQALGARVNALADLEHYDAKNSPTIRAEVQLYERAMDRTHRLLDSLVKHGYVERQIQIQESEAMLVAGVLRRVIAALGLTPEQQKTAQSLLAAEFRALEPRAVTA